MVLSAGTRAGRVPALTKYEVLEELGHGGMATVYRAHDRRLARDVAVKVLHPHLRDNQEIAHRFSTEAKAVAKLRHPNIVEVFDVSTEDDDEQFLVVEFVRGKTLRKILQEVGPMPPEVAAALAVEVAGALAHAHASGVIHRDVKPENVLLEHGLGATDSRGASQQSSSRKGIHDAAPTSDARGERVVVKLTDFGIAKLLDAQGVTSTGQVLGSPAHMAPEQIEGGDVDGRADVFGLGVLLYECMVGHLPFEGSNPAQVLRRVLDGIYPRAEREMPVVGKVWSGILDSALAREAEDRFVDAKTMREAMLAELARVGITSPRVILEAYFDDPSAWASNHAASMPSRLCELALAARRRGDAVAAAADYNRALAYAPDDPQLLRIVASMHRAETRRRFLRRALPLTLGMIVLGTGAFAATRMIKSGSDGKPLSPTGSSSARVPSSASAAASNRSGAASASSVADISPPPVRTNSTAATGAATPKTSARTVTFASLRPPYGVHLRVDGTPSPIEPAQGLSITLDDKPHVLTFTCERDMCEPSSVSLGAGAKDESISIELKILPAKLIVDGEPSHSYGIEEVPTVTLGPGVATEVPMRAGRQTVHVFDRSDTTLRRQVALRAGQLDTVSFKAP